MAVSVIVAAAAAVAAIATGIAGWIPVVHSVVAELTVD